MLLDGAIQLWEVLEKDLLSLCTTPLEKHEPCELVVENTSKFRFAFSLPSKLADSPAHQLF